MQDLVDIQKQYQKIQLIGLRNVKNIHKSGRTSLE